MSRAMAEEADRSIEIAGRNSHVRINPKEDETLVASYWILLLERCGNLFWTFLELSNQGDLTRLDSSWA